MIKDDRDKLELEAKAIKHFFAVESPSVKAAFATFDELYHSPCEVEALTDALDGINNAIEDMCLEHRIAQEHIEELMELHPDAWKDVTL